jgi:hypothetical protein
MRALALAILSLLAASPAAAEVVSASPNGFEVRHTVNLVVKPEVAFSSFADVGAWWDDEHTYSSEGKNMSLELYRAAGFAKGGAEAMAPLVDQVLGEQMKRLRAFAAARPRT